MAVSLYFCRSFGVAEVIVEKLFPFHELSDMDELMDYVQVNLYDVSFSQVVRADQQVAVAVVDSHVTPRSGELYLQILQDSFCSFSEDLLDSLNLFKAFEVVLEWIR
jgi:hypothetical protein